MKSFFDFKGRNILISGGGTGLGLEMAKGFLNQGGNVIIASRNIDKLKITENELRDELSNDATIQSVELDISSEKSMLSALTEVDSIFGNRIDVVVNSSGFNIRNPIEKVSFDEWNSILSTNLTGAFLLAKHSLPRLEKSTAGRMINVTSIFSTVSFLDRVSYASSKGGMLSLTKTLALEWAMKGITVNSISPGPFLTDINKSVLENKENYIKFCEKIPLGRFGNPEEIVTSALFLASPMSSYVTGSDIKVDGGWTSA